MTTNILSIIWIAGYLTNWVQCDYKEMKCPECPGPPYWHRVIETYDVVTDRRVNVMENGQLIELDFCDNPSRQITITNWVPDITNYIPTLKRPNTNFPPVIKFGEMRTKP